MKDQLKKTRREFLGQSSLAGMACLMPFGLVQEVAFGKASKKAALEVYLFSKHLQFLNYDDMCEAAREIGFNGLDMTVRPGGHVLPERVADDLPKAVASMDKYGLQPKMMTTNVTDAADPLGRKVLEIASDLGITHYRTGWLKYPEDKPIPESMAAYAKQLQALEHLNHKLGLFGGYQNHAGKHVGAPIWDLFHMLKDRSSKHIGSQYDIRHAVVEGGGSWELGLRLIHPFINSIVIKDFLWGKANGKWKPINTPLGEGMVDFNRYFSLLKKYGINVPISLHLEYDLGGAEKGDEKITIDKKEVFSKMKKDLKFLRETWETA